MAGKKMGEEQKRYRVVALKANRSDRAAIEQVLRGEAMDPYALMQNLAWANQVYGLRQLLDAGLETERVNGGGNTPLHMACLGGSLEAVQLLIDRGANPEARNDEGDTPLMVALRSSNVRGTEVVCWLDGWAHAKALKPSLEAAMADPDRKPSASRCRL